jgi:hypothetical protein
MVLIFPLTAITVITRSRDNNMSITFKTVSAQEIFSTDAPTLVPVIDSIAYRGHVTMVTSKQSTGKSYMILDFAEAVAKGSKALGYFVAHKGEVMILAMQDSWGRLKLRFQRLFGDDGPPQGIHFAATKETVWPKIGAGFEELLQAELKQHPETTCVIIDTFQKVRPFGGTYAKDDEVMTALNNFAVTHNVAIILVHHTTKGKQSDPFDEIIGSIGIAANAEVKIVLKRDRDKSIGIMYVDGNNIEYKELAVNFDGARWKVIGDAREYCKTDQRQEVRNAVANANNPVGTTVTDIQKILAALGIHKKPGSLRRLVSKMADDGELLRLSRGHYIIPKEAPTLPLLPQLAKAGMKGNNGNNLMVDPDNPMSR